MGGRGGGRHRQLGSSVARYIRDPTHEGAQPANAMHARQALCMRRPLSTGVTIRDLPAASCVGAAPVDDRGCASCWPGVTPGVLWRGPRSCARGPSASRTGVVSLAGGVSGVSGRRGHKARLATRPEGRSQVIIRYDTPPPGGPRDTWRPRSICTRMPHMTRPVHARHVMHVGRGAPALATPPFVAHARSGRRHTPPRTDRGLRDSPSTSLRAGHRWSRPAHKIAFFRSMVTSVLD